MKNSRINGVEFVGKTDDKIQFVSYGSSNHLKLWQVKVEKDEFMTQYTVDGLS